MIVAPNLGAYARPHAAFVRYGLAARQSQAPHPSYCGAASNSDHCEVMR